MQLAARVLLALLYLGVVLLPFRPFVSRFSTHLIGDHGDSLLQHLHCSWQWLALAEGRFSEILRLPTMAPYASGLSFGEPLAGIVWPFAPLYLLTGSSAAAFNVAIVASFLLLGVATLLWVREVTGSMPAGLLAGMLVLFSPWRLHYLSAANVLTLHYAVFGMWLLSRWLRKPGLVTLLGAALLFQLQLVTSAQAGVPAVYLSVVWLAVVWMGRRFSFESTRMVQLAAAAALFVGLSLPWLSLFREAFDAGSGLPPMSQMARYSSSFTEMARMLGGTGPLGICAALGLLVLPIGLRRGLLPRGAGWTLLGVVCGGAALFVIARGPTLGTELGAPRLPGYYLAQLLPLAGMFRAPIRLAGLTPLVLALIAGSGWAILSRAAGTGRTRWLAYTLPLFTAAAWTPLDPGMAAPIEARPDDLALARALSDLPPDAHILSLPMELGLPGAAVDERVRVHRRRQIGGFASVVPPAFQQAALALGQWPRSGLDSAWALSATHVVVPRAWFEAHREAALETGHVQLADTSRHVVLALPPQQRPPGSLRIEAPTTAAAGRWLTLALFRDTPHFEPRGHEILLANWRQGDELSQVEATLLHPGVVGPHSPSRMHVPTPSVPGRYQLQLLLPGRPHEIEVEIEDDPTSFDLPISDADIAPTPGYRTPDFVRAAAAFAVDVELTARRGPILLASSRHRLPERRGETRVLLQYRADTGERFTLRLPGPALVHDLVPGKASSLRWNVPTPRRAGSYDLYARLVAAGQGDRPMDWRPLLRGIEVSYD